MGLKHAWHGLSLHGRHGMAAYNAICAEENIWHEFEHKTLHEHCMSLALDACP